MPRRLPLSTVSRFVELATKALKSIEPRSEERKIVDTYLRSVSRAAKLAAKSKMNKRRGWVNVADRQKTRSEKFTDEATELLPLVEEIVAHGRNPEKAAEQRKALLEKVRCMAENDERSPAEALSVIATTERIFDEDDSE